MQHGGPQFPFSVLKVSSPVLKQGSTVQSELSRTHYIAQASLPFTEGPLLEAEGSRRLLSPRYGTPPLNNGGPQHPTGLCQVQACLAASDSHMVFGQRSGPRSKLGGQGTPLKTFRLMQVSWLQVIFVSNDLLWLGRWLNSTGCSCRGPRFDSQHPQVAHNPL